MSIKNIYKKFLEKSMSIGIYAFLFLLPWQTRLILRQNEIGYSEVSVYVIDIVLIVLLLISLANAKCKNHPPRLVETTTRRREAGNAKWQYKIKNEILVLAGLFLFWNVISVFWAGDKVLVLQHVFWLILSVGLGWLIYKAENIKKIIFWFCVGLILPAWLAIWQFATQSSFANKWLGLAMHKAALGGTSVVETFSNGLPQRWLRAYGSFDHPNILGAVMGVGIIVLIVEYARNGRITEAEERNGRNKVDIKLKYIVSYTAIISFAAACFLSFSRSAWLGLVIGLGGIGFFLLRNKLRSNAFNHLKMLLIIAAVFLVLGITYKDVILVRTDGAARLERKSLDDRALYFQQAKEIIKQNPITGVGAGNYVAYLKKENPNNSPWTYQPVHNVFVLIWAELGIVGLLAFVVLCGTMIVRAYKNNLLGFCLMLALVPAMFLDHWLWSLHFGLLFLGVIVGITLKYNRNKVEI